MEKANKKEKKEKKGIIAKIVEKLDKTLEEKARKIPYCRSDDKKADSSCC